MKIVDSIWFTEMGSSAPIGIVICKDENAEEAEAFIGTGYGINESTDAKHIARTGARLRLSTVEFIASQLR